MPTTCGNTSSLGVTHEDDTKIGATITSTPEATTGAVITSTPEATTGASVSPSVAPTATPEEVATNAAIKVVTNVTGAAVKVISGTSVVTSGTAVTGTSVAGTFDSGKLENGTYIVEVSKNGFRTEKKEVIVAGKDQTVEINLVGTVASIESATEYILDKNNAADFKLALTYKDADGKVVAAPAGATVTFVDNKGVFNTDGTIKEAVKNGISEDIKTITVVATVKSEEVNLTKEFTVDVVSASDWKTVQEAKLQRAVTVNEVAKTADASVAVVGDTISLVPTKATKYDGNVVSGDAVKEGTWENVKAVSSSDQTKLIVNIKAKKIVLTPVSAGEATITVALNSGETFTKIVTVKEEARKAKAATTDKALVEFSSAATAAQEIKVTVTDQYGDALVGQEVYAKSVKTTDPVATETNKAKTNEEGKATLTVTLSEKEVEGKDTFKIYADTTEIGTFEVSYAKAGETATYGLELQNADASFDVNGTADKKDGVLKFVARDAKGILSDNFEFEKNVSKNEVTASNRATDPAKKKEFKVVTAGAVDAVDLNVDEHDDSKLIVSPKKAGTVTILVKEGEIVRAEYKVTVVDTTPTVTSFKVKTGAKLGIKSANETVLSLDNFKLSSALEIKGSNDATLSFKANAENKKFDVVDKNDKVIAELELFATGDKDKLAIQADGVSLKKGTVAWEKDETVNVVVKLKEKANGNTTVLPVPVAVDDTKPSCDAATSGYSEKQLVIAPKETVDVVVAETSRENWAKDTTNANVIKYTGAETGANIPNNAVGFTLTDNADNTEDFVATYANSKWTVVTKASYDKAQAKIAAEAAIKVVTDKANSVETVTDKEVTDADNAIKAYTAAGASEDEVKALTGYTVYTGIVDQIEVNKFAEDLVVENILAKGDQENTKALKVTLNDTAGDNSEYTLKYEEVIPSEPSDSTTKFTVENKGDQEGTVTESSVTATAKNITGYKLKVIVSKNGKTATKEFALASADSENDFFVIIS